jgi:hypothetical protein
MHQHPLRPLVGASPRRLVLMAVIYLDDSGTHGSSPIMTMAGYVFARDNWEAFEREGKSFLDAERVPVFHAKDFDKRRSRSPFSGWSIIKQTSFAHRWFAIAKKHISRGITISLPKALYEERRREYRKNQNISVYGQCLNDVLMEFHDNDALWKLLETEGLSVILELGNKNNAGCIEWFNKIRKRNKWENELKRIDECAKEDCVAIQLADYLAYYSWRHAVESHEVGKMVPFPTFLDIATGMIKTRGQLGTDFFVAPRENLKVG